MRIEAMLAAAAAADPDRIAIVDGEHRLGYGELDRLSTLLARHLGARGIGRGDRVVVFMDNGREAAVAIYAIWKAGAVFCPLNPSSRDDGLKHVVDNCEARAILTEARLSRRCLALATGRPLTVIAGGDPALLPQGVVPLASCLVPGAADPPQPGPDTDLAMIIHTSGSTGRPKGVMMTHASMDFAAASIGAYLESSRSDVVLSVLPLSFTYGLYQLLVAVRAGATLLLERSFAFPVEVLGRARAEGVTCFPLVPTMAATLLSMRDASATALPGLRSITNAAAPLEPERIDRLRKLYPSARIFLMYGLTECARAAYLDPDEVARRPESVGRPLAGTTILIVAEDGHELPAGEVGELVVQGPHVMLGYWRDEAATRQALRPLPGRRGVWLHTGDLFRRDADGFLYFVGRRDDIVKVRGEKVAPRQVEAALLTCPGVVDALVVGLPDPAAGHLLHAVIVRDADTLAERDILRHCARILPDVMVPKTVEFRAELPKTPSGKVLRRQVARQGEQS